MVLHCARGHRSRTWQPSLCLPCRVYRIRSLSVQERFMIIYEYNSGSILIIILFKFERFTFNLVPTPSVPETRIGSL